jgi:hypothetical protein
MVSFVLVGRLSFHLQRISVKEVIALLVVVEVTTIPNVPHDLQEAIGTVQLRVHHRKAEGANEFILCCD